MKSKRLIQISPELLDAWRERLEYGDIKKLMQYTQRSKPVILKAINKGEGLPATVLLISSFFSKKKKQIKIDVNKQALAMFENDQPTDSPQEDTPL